MKMRKLFKKGFTLVELVVVIAVIAVLAAVSVGAYFGVTDSANSSAAEQYKKQIKDLWIMYSVSQEYVEGNTDEVIQQNAEYFCLTYSRDNGPQDVIVNYRLIDVNPNGFVSFAKDSTFTNTGIIFLIDSQYDSYFVTCGQRIIAESGLLKSEEQFKSLMEQEESSFMSDEDREVFESLGYGAFELAKIEIEDGSTVLGYEFYTINIENAPSGSPSVLNIKVKDSLFGGSGYYQNADVGIKDADNYSVVGKPYVIKQNNKIIDTSIPFTKENVEISETEPTLLNEESYDYSIGKINLVYEGNSLSQNPNIYNYPIIERRSTGEVTFYKYFEDVTFSSSGTGNYLFVGNATLSSEFTIPSNYTMVIDYSIINSDTETTDNNISQMNSFVKYELHESDKYKSFSKEVKEGGFLGIGAQVVAPARIFEAISNNDQEPLKSVIDTNGAPTFNISSDGVLKVEGNLFNEGIFYSAGGSYQSNKVKYASTIINDGKIIVSSTGKLRSIGLIKGIGIIDTKEGAIVSEPFKITSFLGGSITSSVYKNIFPFADSQFDSIQCKLILNKNVYYGGPTAINVSYAGICQCFVPMVGPSDSLFKIEDNLIDENNNQVISKIEKKYNVEKKVSQWDFFGKITDESFNVNLKVSVIGNISLSSKQANFPISNMDIRVHEGSELHLTNGKYDIYPTSSLRIDGTVIVDNDSYLTIANFDEYTHEFTNPVTKALFNNFKNFADNKILYINCTNGFLRINNGKFFVLNSIDGTYQDDVKIAKAIDASNEITDLYKLKFVENNGNNSVSFDLKTGTIID